MLNPLDNSVYMFGYGNRDQIVNTRHLSKNFQMIKYKLRVTYADGFTTHVALISAEWKRGTFSSSIFFTRQIHYLYMFTKKPQSLLSELGSLAGLLWINQNLVHIISRTQLLEDFFLVTYTLRHGKIVFFTYTSLFASRGQSAGSVQHPKEHTKGTTVATRHRTPEPLVSNPAP